MSIAVRVTGYLARVAIFCSMAAVTGCHQEPVSRVYIEDYGWDAHGSPQVDVSQLPKGWIVGNETGDPGVGHGSTTSVTVNGGPIRILVVPATNGPSTLPPTTGIGNKPLPSVAHIFKGQQWSDATAAVTAAGYELHDASGLEILPVPLGFYVDLSDGSGLVVLHHGREGAVTSIMWVERFQGPKAGRDEHQVANFDVPPATK